jgi:hypothetical protein
MTDPITPEYPAELLAKCEEATPMPSDHELSGERLALARLALTDAVREALPRLVAEIGRLGKERDAARVQANRWERHAHEQADLVSQYIARAELAEANALGLMEQLTDTEADLARIGRELGEAQAERDRLREALTPFASVSDFRALSDLCSQADLRAARKALEKTEHGK